jgi:hypothetical protein
MPPFSSLVGADAEDPYSPTVKTGKKIKNDDGDSDRDGSLIFGGLSGFDVCGGFGDMTLACGSLPNPASALFKDRPCAECGRNCNKFEGYTKKIVEKKKKFWHRDDKEPSAPEVLYYHNACLQAKEKRDHAKSYSSVLKDLGRPKNAPGKSAPKNASKALDKKTKGKGGPAEPAKTFSLFQTKKKTAMKSNTKNTEGSESGEKKSYFSFASTKKKTQNVKLESSQKKKSSFLSRVGKKKSRASKNETTRNEVNSVSSGSKTSAAKKKKKAFKFFSSAPSKKRVETVKLESPEKRKSSFLGRVGKKPNTSKNSVNGGDMTPAANKKKMISRHFSFAPKQSNKQNIQKSEEKKSSFLGRVGKKKSKVSKNRNTHTEANTVNRGNRTQVAKKKRMNFFLGKKKSRVSKNRNIHTEANTVNSGNRTPVAKKKRLNFFQGKKKSRVPNKQYTHTAVASVNRGSKSPAAKKKRLNFFQGKKKSRVPNHQHTHTAVNSVNSGSKSHAAKKKKTSFFRSRVGKKESRVRNYQNTHTSATPAAKKTSFFRGRVGKKKSRVPTYQNTHTAVSSVNGGNGTPAAKKKKTSFFRSRVGKKKSRVQNYQNTHYAVNRSIKTSASRKKKTNLLSAIRWGKSSSRRSEC